MEGQAPHVEGAYNGPPLKEVRVIAHLQTHMLFQHPDYYKLIMSQHDVINQDLIMMTYQDEFQGPEYHKIKSNVIRRSVLQ